MPTAYKLSDPVGELGRILPGDALEVLKDLLHDPGSDVSVDKMGEMARIGQAFVEIGNRFLDPVKQTMEERLAGGRGSSSREIQSGVIFEWKPPTTSVAINSRAVKEAMPPAGFPEFYNERNRKATLNLTFADR